MGHFGLEIIGASGSGRPLMDCIRIAQNELVKWLVDDSNLASATFAARYFPLARPQITTVVRSGYIKECTELFIH